MTDQSDSHSTPIEWNGRSLILLDQRALPHTIKYVVCNTAEDVRRSIVEMVVRGAPAIGISAAFGAAMAARDRYRESPQSWHDPFGRDVARLREARPTAVNLMWALDRMAALANATHGDPGEALTQAASEMLERDIADNRALGAHGARHINPGEGVLTHCNAGALATGGFGTALGVIRAAYRARRIGAVYATETRPWFQGARLTAWELMNDGIDVTLITEGTAATLMRDGRVGWLITGADRVAANGDTANKIGTYALACLARMHGVRFMVAAPLSTIDLNTASGAEIPIETRSAEEVTHVNGERIAAPGVDVFNPVFDVTPAAYVDVLSTEKGAIERPDAESIRQLFGT